MAYRKIYNSEYTTVEQEKLTVRTKNLRLWARNNIWNQNYASRAKFTRLLDEIDLKWKKKQCFGLKENFVYYTPKT